MIVVDAGAYLEALLDSGAGRTVQESMLRDTPVAPELIDAEVLHRLILLEKNGILAAPRVDAAVARLRISPLRRLSHRPLLAAARGYGAALSGYDAFYVATAAAHRATLVTVDLRLARTAGVQFGLPVMTVPTSGR